MYKFQAVEQILMAHFYTPFDVVRNVRFRTAPKPPFTKGSPERCRTSAKWENPPYDQSS